MLNLSALRHDKETLYLAIGGTIGGIIWFIFFICWFRAVMESVGVFFSTVFLVFIFVFSSWLTGQYFRAQVFGNAVRVSKEQFPKVAEIIEEIARELNLDRVVDVFVLSGQGALNALALRLFSHSYVFLHGELVDLTLRRGAYDELKMIIGHELAHHALGHVSLWKSLLLFPSRIIPFLGAAYSRACELSADRVGMVLAGNNNAAARALLAIILGSEALASEVDPRLFAAQERYVPPVMGFIYELYATHPRMTRRIIELRQYASRISLTPGMASTAVSSIPAEAAGKGVLQGFAASAETSQEIAASREKRFCPACGQEVFPGDRFCLNCGRRLV